MIIDFHHHILLVTNRICCEHLGTRSEIDTYLTQPV